jgi:hypothetical protein
MDNPQEKITDIVLDHSQMSNLENIEHVTFQPQNLDL